MPTYEYRCKSCGEQLEVVQSFTDDSLSDCPVCGGPLRKVFGSIGITFKGSGFYKTDSRSSSTSAAASKSSESSSGGDGKDSSSTKETKEPSGSKEPAASSSTSSTKTATTPAS